MAARFSGKYHLAGRARLVFRALVILTGDSSYLYSAGGSVAVCGGESAFRVAAFSRQRPIRCDSFQHVQEHLFRLVQLGVDMGNMAVAVIGCPAPDYSGGLWLSSSKITSCELPDSVGGGEPVCLPLESASAAPVPKVKCEGGLNV